MKYSLRTLLILATLLPPVLAGAYFFLGYAREFLAIMTPLGWVVAAFVGALVVIPLALCTWALVKLGHRDTRNRDSLLTWQVSLDLAIFALFVVLGCPAIVAGILTMPSWWPIS